MFAKLVGARRGGYCFEQGRLFLDALDALGFAARPLLARVWLGIAGREGASVPPRTHTLALVDLPEGPWIADAGFGGSYAPPLTLADGAEAIAPDGARFRLRADPDHGWMLQRHGDPLATDGRGTGPGWQDQYSFTLDPVFPADLLLANHWVQTAPGTRFVEQRIVSVPLPQGFASLTGTRYRRRNGDSLVEADLADPRVYRLRLALLFGLQLSADDVAALGLF